MNLICLFKGHKRGKTTSKFNLIGRTWRIECKRCGYKFEYSSPLCRLIGKEIYNGFDGK